MLFSHILVAYDGSEQSVKSLDKAIEFAKQDPQVKLTVLHVVSIPPRTVQMSLYQDFKQSILDEANDIIKPAKEKLTEIPNPSQAYVKEAPSYNAILEEAYNLNCDLIVMGSRGLSGIKEFLGSVSHLIVQKSKIPVMVMKS
ncbi:universal stress protein [Niallia sp. Krafla_26]|uniref:universal stress protein n=1 Tax=Niallia sp. Krafla_26 TaxID=3064703 RepID=UPI003D166089